MIKTVTLMSNDFATVIGTVLLDIEFSGEPSMLTWRQRAFTASPSMSGTAVFYQETDVKHLADDAVTAPKTAA